jgi:primosomal protein N' (replication factor Y)
MSLNIPSPAAKSKEPDGYAEVAFNLPLSGTFTYLIPPPLRGLIQRGMRVFVPFGKRRITGYVVSTVGHFDKKIPLKPIEEALDTEPAVSDEILGLARWVADYYQASWGEAIRAALPAGLDEEAREHFSITDAGRDALQAGASPASALLRLLTQKSGQTLKQIQRALDKDFSPTVFARLRREENIVGDIRIKRSTAPFVKESTVQLAVGKILDDTARAGFKRSPKQLNILEVLGTETKTLAELILAVPGCSGPLRELRKKGWVETAVRHIPRQSPAEKNPAPDTAVESPLKFTPDQERVFNQLRSSMEAARFGVFLLHGVTGSGKTEIYLRCIRQTLEMGKSAIMLVPEISLTPQTVERFRKRFGHNVAILHSGLSETERFLEWKSIREGRVFIVVGARSAVFAPFANLGLIVIDEEHDSSYKQDSTPRYHARDTAIVRAKSAGATVILGSATPSLESRKNAETGKYGYLSLPARVGDRLLPLVDIIDMRKEKTENKNFSLLSGVLKDAIRRRLERGEQTFLFLNRRGTANYVFCKDCGFVFQCLRCSVTMTFHGTEDVLRCHYCDSRAKVPSKCPECFTEVIRFTGHGTQKLETEVHRLFPTARVSRIDRDTTQGRSAFETMYRNMADGSIDILIGTQMITKGHDFPSVTLVGVVQADISLNIPDFRSGERSFQLLTQVAGRAGRGEVPGKVLIQTHHPDHYVFDFVRDHNYEKFYAVETALRERLHYPPFTRLAALEVESANEAHGEALAERLRSDLATALGRRKDVEIIGPARSALYRINDKFRRHLILRSTVPGALQALLKDCECIRQWKKIFAGKAKLSIDVDPVNML